MRLPLVVGNWKMNKTVSEAIALTDRLLPLLGERDGAEVAIAPAFPALYSVSRLLEGSGIHLAAQNVYWQPDGAFTGEVSATMLREVGCRYVILGHSERRQYFGESDLDVSRKVEAVLTVGLVPILCVGETLLERDRGEALTTVERQMRQALTPLGSLSGKELVVAYEPVWAIGTGRNATATQAQEVHGHIRRTLHGVGGAGLSQTTRVLYGGSVKPSNIAALMSQEDVDGALVGGASLEAETFASIVRFRV